MRTVKFKVDVFIEVPDSVVGKVAIRKYCLKEVRNWDRTSLGEEVLCNLPEQKPKRTKTDQYFYHVDIATKLDDHFRTISYKVKAGSYWEARTKAVEKFLKRKVRGDAYTVTDMRLSNV